jgi:hypothetical protein
MGITVENRVVLKEKELKAEQLLFLENSSMSNTGDCGGEKSPCYAYQSFVSLDTTVSSAVYDILVRKKGTVLKADKQVKTIDSLIRYHFDGKKYTIK